MKSDFFKLSFCLTAMISSSFLLCTPMQLGKAEGPGISEILWGDDAYKELWRDLKNMESASLQKRYHYAYLDTGKDMLESIVVSHSTKPRTRTTSKFTDFTEIMLPPVPVKTAWMKVLGYFLDVFSLHTTNTNTLKLNGSHNEENYTFTSSRKDTAEKYREFISYIMEEFSRRLFLDSIAKLNYSPQQTNIQSYPNTILATLIGPHSIESKVYGKSFRLYMDFIDIVDFLLSLGIKNVDAIERIKRPKWKTHGQKQKNFKGLVGISSFHKMEKMSNESGPRLLFNNPFDETGIKDILGIKKEMEKSSYMASSKVAGSMDQINKIRLDSCEDMVEMSGVIGRSPTWMSFIKNIDHLPKEKKLMVNKITRIAKISMEMVDNNSERIVMEDMIESMVMELRPLEDLDSEEGLEYVINHFAFFFLIKEISYILCNFLHKKNPSLYSEKELSRAKAIQFFRQLIKSSSFQREYQKILLSSNISQLGKSYRVYIGLNEQLGYLSRIAQCNLITDSSLDSLTHNLMEILEFDSKETSIQRLVKSHKQKLGITDLDAIGTSENTSTSIEESRRDISYKAESKKNPVSDPFQSSNIFVHKNTPEGLDSFHISKKLKYNHKEGRPKDENIKNLSEQYLEKGHSNLVAQGHSQLCPSRTVRIFGQNILTD
ncbi:hypothetical protein DFH28DRAFT_577723 [Melampsora americana]|nr:hypothetical protein DFH28DRAFT_577723 [Melampsora americana]